MPYDLSISRRTHSTPFTSRVHAAGVRVFTVYNHMLLAAAFASIVEDYHHLKKHVQDWDVACQRQIEEGAFVGRQSASASQALDLIA